MGWFSKGRGGRGGVLSLIVRKGGEGGWLAFQSIDHRTYTYILRNHVLFYICLGFLLKLVSATLAQQTKDICMRNASGTRPSTLHPDCEALNPRDSLVLPVSFTQFRAVSYAMSIQTDAMENMLAGRMSVGDGILWYLYPTHYYSLSGR